MMKGTKKEWDAWHKLTEVYAKDPVWITELVEVSFPDKPDMPYVAKFWGIVEYVLRQWDETFEDFEESPTPKLSPEKEARIRQIDEQLARAGREKMVRDTFNFRADPQRLAAL